jgi:hypothetical protein
MKPDFREPVLDYCAEIQRRKILVMAQIWPSTGTCSNLARRNISAIKK